MRKGFKQFLAESSITAHQLEAFTKEYLLTLWGQWKAKYPNEPDIDDPAYMEPEFLRSTYNLGGWIFEQVAKGNYIDSANIIDYPKGAVKCSTVVGRCYYNAVDFVMKNDTAYGDLAYAFFINKKAIADTQHWIETIAQGKFTPRPFLFEGLEHAVIIDKANNIIDPTLGDDQQGNIVIYEKVPKAEWSKFKYKPDDANQDARDFYDEYILKKLDINRKMPNFKKWIALK